MPRRRRYRHKTRLQKIQEQLSPKKILVFSIFFILLVVSLAFFVKTPTVIDVEAATILNSQRVQDRIFAFGLDDGGDTYIISAIHADHGVTRLISLKKAGDLWSERTSLALNCTVKACPSDARKVKLGGSAYIYFVTEHFGDSVGRVAFNLFSPTDSHLYSISAYGAMGNINQPEQIPKDVSNNKEVYDFLTRQIEESSDITRLGPAVRDMLNPANAVQKWELDNDFVRPAMISSAVPMKFTYYAQDLADAWQGAKVTDTVENSHYKFTAYLKGGVVGFDKHTKRYFVLWVPADPMEWPIALRFVDPNTIRIGSANRGPTLTVYLATNRITSP